MSGSGDVAVVMPARDESDRIGATVRAAAALPGVDLVLVVDDGSRDETRILAERAGAAVISHPKPRGKGAAMETGARAGRRGACGMTRKPARSPGPCSSSTPILAIPRGRPARGPSRCGAARRT